jgi:signal transduction histidine kinase
MLNVMMTDEVRERAAQDRFLAEAWAKFERDPDAGEHARASWSFTQREYEFARAVRDETGALEGVILLRRSSSDAAWSVWRNTIYLFSAGFVALGLAVLVFYLITSRIILSPVRALRETAESVQQGDLAIRSDIATGDEFEELAETFNHMVQGLADSQDQLRRINASLDEQVNELAERNIALYEASRIKDEFLASVTHELRTPMNSVLGFAELLEEQVQKDEGTDYDAVRLTKRRRYVENILSEGKRLLELINNLLEMAKMEAGRSELKVKPTDLRALAELQVALMKPMADKRSVEIRLEAPAELPTIFTDPDKLKQILFNLLSNAVKFTADAADAARAAAMAQAALDNVSPGAQPRSALVTLRVEHLRPGSADAERVRISVLDTGPGIAPEDHKRIFEKFTQLDSGITRRHAGTGLGLYICKQLTTLLQGEIMVDSDLNRGAMFSVLLPIAIEPGPGRPAATPAAASAEPRDQRGLS